MTTRTNIFQEQRFSNGSFKSLNNDYRVYDYEITSTKKYSLVAFGSSIDDEWTSAFIITSFVLNDLSGYDKYILDSEKFDDSEQPITQAKTIGDLIDDGSTDLVNYLIKSSYIFTGVPENEYRNFFTFSPNSLLPPVSLYTYESTLNQSFFFSLKDSTEQQVTYTDVVGLYLPINMPNIVIDNNNNNKDISLGFVFSVIGIIVLIYILVYFLRQN